jgi:hypothetical protein
MKKPFSLSPLTLVMLLALLLQLAFGGYQLSEQRYYLEDSKEYVQAAENLRAHGTLYCGEWEKRPHRTDFYSKRPPLYPLLLAGIGWPGSMVLLQNLLSLFNLWLMMRLLLSLGFPRKRLLWALPFLLLYPAQFIYSNLIMTEVLLQSLLLGMAWSLSHFVSQVRGKYLGIYVALLSLGILLKPVMYVFAFVHPLLMGYFYLRKYRHKALLPVAFLPLVVVLAYSGWNHSRTGAFHFSSIQSINLLQYNTYYTLLRAEGEAVADSVVDGIAARADRISSYPERQAYIRSASVEQLSQHPGAYLGLHLKGMAHFFIDPGRFDLYSFLGLEKREGKGKGLLYHYSQEGYRGVFNYLKTQPLGLLAWLLLIALAHAVKLLGGLRFAFRRSIPLDQRLLLGMWVLYLAGLTGPLGASRFAVPVFPLLLIMALLGAEGKR